MSEIPARPGIPRIGWIVAFLAAAGLIGLAYVSLKSTRPPALPSNLEKISKVPGFQLTDQTGKSITLDDLKGKIWAANFIFTRCKGPCPITTLRMQELHTKLKKARGNVALVTFTVDPEYDTPEILKTFGEQQGAEPSSWKFLTGTPDDIQKIVVAGLLQPLAKEPDGTPAHSTRIVLVDREGWLRGYQDGLDPEAVQKLMVDIGELLREGSLTK
ncbi:MAG: SCO family protein [Proteobacteria bacterium]|jgi:protein SCO1/2|nr:SCO family protein [Pseudomonadota bacterium]